MPKASWIQNSFNAGELSPQLKGRPDIEKYKNGCETVLNFIPQIYGPAQKRPGTRYVNTVKTSANKTRLIPFEYSVGDAYVLEFGNHYIRFYTQGGVLLNGGVPYEIFTSYSSAVVGNIHFAQSADVLYLAHPDHPPRKLQRFDTYDWRLEDVVFDPPPFRDENTTDVTLTISAVTVTGTGLVITASEPIFSFTSYIRHIKFSETVGSKHDFWETNKPVTSGDYRYHGDNLYQATSNGTTGTRSPIHLRGTESDGNVDWEYIHSGYGYVYVGGYISTTKVIATVIKRLPDSALTGTVYWANSSWSPTDGYPKAVAFYEDRLWFAGSRSRPQTLWASFSGDYENHEYGTNDDNALNYTIASQDINTIQWLAPGQILAIGTAGGEFSLSAGSFDEPVTPTNIRIAPQTTYGCADLQPFKIGGSVLFLQRAGRKIRELTYNFESDSYVAPNMTVLAEHITSAGVVDMAYQQEPSQVLWVPDKNGQLVGMTYERTEDVVGWHRHTLGGIVESVVTIPHWDGDQDSTWMIIKRTINGNVVRYIEYIEKYLTDDHAHFVDCGAVYDGAPTTTISGLTWLEGEEVTILADGAVHPNRTVTSGSISLQVAASVVIVGLSYDAILKTMPIEAGAADGTAQGKTIRLNNIVIRLHQTGPGLFYGADINRLDELHPRTTTMNMDAPVPLFTGDTPALPWPGEYEQSPQMIIKHSLPTPCTVIALMPQLVTYDR